MSALLTALSIAALVSLLILLPIVLAVRDLRSGRSDPSYREPGH